MPFLPPNQQHQSTEGTTRQCTDKLLVIHLVVTQAVHRPVWLKSVETDTSTSQLQLSMVSVERATTAAWPREAAGSQLSAIFRSNAA